MNGAPAAPAAAAAGGGTAAAAAAAAVPVPQPAVPPKILNLVIPHIDGRLLLGRKLRGFGEGYVNGFGGKVEVGETIEASARRELLEEAGIVATDMQHCGLLNFVFDDRAQPWEVHVFRVSAFSGEPTRSDEMEPSWFDPGALPFDRMWADDRHWYPLFLAGHCFTGTFHFEDTHTLVAHSLRRVDADALLLPKEPL